MQNAVILVAVLGGIFGLVLAIAGRKFAVDTDPRIDEIAALLPGANCGSCGFAGCCNMAEAIVSGEAPDAAKCMACPADNQKAINAIPSGELTAEKKLEVIDSLREYFPVIKGPLSAELNEGVHVYSTGTVDPKDENSRQAAAQTYLKDRVDSKGNNVKDKYGYGFNTFVDPGEAINSILDWTQDSFNIEDKEKKLAEMKDLFPWVRTVLDQIKEEPLRSKFSKNFIKEFIQYSVAEEVEDNLTGEVELKLVMINTNNAVKGFLNEISTAFNEGIMSHLIQNTNLNGEGKVNIKNVDKLGDLNTKIYSNFKNLFLKRSKDLGTIPSDLSTLLGALGIHVSSTMTEALINSDLKQNKYNNTKIDILLTNVDYLVKTLKKNSDRTDYNPVKKNDVGNIYGNYSAIINQLSSVLPKIIEASTFENGKMYYAFSNPSFLGRWISALSNTGKNFEEYVQQRYAESRYFKNGEIWNNQWLYKLSADPHSRKILEKKSQLHFNKTSYIELGEGNYTLSLMHEFFYDKGKKYAWYRVPILSNKPASEFIKFLRYSGVDYKENISRGLKKTFNSEIIRMKTVLERANINRSKIDGFDINNLSV